MSWTQPEDLRAQVHRVWDRGALLGSLVADKSLFPLRLRLQGPASLEWADRFDEVREWITNLQEMKHIRLVWRDVRHRLLGNNALPCEVWIDTIDDALALIARQRDVKSFVQLLDATRQRRPELLAWLAKRPLTALALREQWSSLLDVVDWLGAHPRPGIYLRQVDIPGIGSKFVESNRSVLAELLDRVLPVGAIDSSAAGVGGFNRRYGFLDKPARLRFRVLDPACSLVAGVKGGDITLDAASFRALDTGVSHVFITENEINFLAFPSIPDAMVVFGSGYGFEALGSAEWLSGRQLHYWGDIDTHGFAILDQLRSQFAHVRSFLMDRDTLMAGRTLWVCEEKPLSHDLSRLTAEECGLYNDLRDQRLGRNLRLEQEMIGFERVQEAIAQIVIITNSERMD
ncbi:MAG: Wadjet anti-phage system protein JetD domain-containing protein [Rhodanobacter sp.]